MTGFEPARADAHAYSKGVTSPGEALFHLCSGLNWPDYGEEKNKSGRYQNEGCFIKN